MRFEVLVVVSMSVTIFWDVAQCSVVDADKHFRRAYCICHQGVESLHSARFCAVSNLLLYLAQQLCEQLTLHSDDGGSKLLNCWLASTRNMLKHPRRQPSS